MNSSTLGFPSGASRIEAPCWRYVRIASRVKKARLAGKAQSVREEKSLPCSAHSRLSSAALLPNSSGERKAGNQPSPCCTTRLSAARVSPPNQSGGWGFWMGLGEKPTSDD